MIGRELQEIRDELRWPNGMTTAELDSAELEPWERERLAELIRKGMSLAPYYRDQLRMRGKSWLGIPRAEQTANRMGRVLVLLGRIENLQKVKAGYTFVGPCHPAMGECDREGKHAHVYTLTLV